MLQRLRWSAFGLRGRIVGMVLVTTVATLFVATVGLLPRLESSLRTASERTLESDVGKQSKARGELATFGRTPLYALAAEFEDRALVLDDPSAKGAAAEAQKHLDADNTALNDTLGASNLFLISYIGPDDRGSFQTVEGGQAAAEPSQQTQRGVEQWGDVAKAFVKDRPLYSFATIGGKQFVRAAIPLPKADAVLVVYKSIDGIPDAVSAVRHAFELAAGAGLLLTLLLAIPLAATLVRRLQLLRQAALRVAVSGAASEFPVDRARDEVGDLARSFAIMQRRLRHQEEARRAFVATASHELRTPLASLDGMLELLDEGLHDEHPDLTDAQDLLERARVQSRRLGRLAADLLDLSRLDAEVALRSEPVELGELARAVVAEFELALGERGVGVVIQEGGGSVWALADPGSVARILRILIDNALRVAPRGSDIAVALASDPVPTLSVIDRGPGVAAEERTLIFERFKRGRDTGGEAGFGLGLAIGRELAERMGGSLGLAGAAGPGASFTLTLPAAQAPLADPVASASGV